MVSSRARTSGKARYGNDSIRRRKSDPVAEAHMEYVDYKDIAFLRKFVDERGRLLPARITGCGRNSQRLIAAAVKRARAIALLPYCGEH